MNETVVVLFNTPTPCSIWYSIGPIVIDLPVRFIYIILYYTLPWTHINVRPTGVMTATCFLHITRYVLNVQQRGRFIEWRWYSFISNTCSLSVAGSSETAYWIDFNSYLWCELVIFFGLCLNFIWWIFNISVIVAGSLDSVWPSCWVIRIWIFWHFNLMCLIRLYCNCW